MTTATMNCNVGPAYCRKPIVESFSRRNATPKKSKGTAVIIPDNESRPRVTEEIRWATGKAKNTSAAGSRIRVSTSKP